MYNYRKCQELGHLEYESSHICTFKGCDKCVFLCAICIQTNIHKHEQLKQDHIVNLKQFQQQTQQIKQSINDQQERKGKIIKNIQTIIETQLQEIFNNIRQQNFQEILQIIDDIQNDLIKSDKQQIKKVINIQDDINQQDKFLTQIEKKFIQKLGDLLKTIKDYNYQDFGFSLNNVNYINCYEYQCKKGIEAVHISNNETYMAIGQINKKLTIVNLKTKETVKKIDFNSIITSCRFSDLNLLFVGDQLGFIYCYDQEFNQIYKQQLHLKSVKGIKFIGDSKIVTYSEDQQILVCDMNAIEQFEIKPSEFIIGIEYFKLQDKILSFFKDINFYDGQTGKFLLKQQNIHHKQSILQIQFIEQKQQMISSNENILILWQIDQQNLRKLKAINLYNISNMSVVSDGNLIMIVLKDSIHFYDGALNQFQDLDITEALRNNKQDLNNIICMRNIQQINSMNFIIIQRRGSLQLLEKIK